MSITLKSSVSNYASSSNSVSVSATVAEGDTIILVASSRYNTTTPTGYTLIFSESVTNENMYFYKKTAEASGTESVTLQQTGGSGRFQVIIHVFAGEVIATHEAGMNFTFTQSSGTTMTKEITKLTASTACLWGICCYNASTGSTRNYTATPDDMTRTQAPSSPSNGVRLATFFDDGTAAQTHTISYTNTSGSRQYGIDAVVLTEPAPAAKFLIEDESQLYTIQNSALVPIVGTLSAALFASDGFDDLTDAGTLLATLTRPKLYAWNTDVLREVTVSVDAVPYPQDIIAQTALVEVIGVDEITATYSGSPLVAINVDNVGWICYNSIDEQWEAASDHDGMSIATMQSIPAEEWETLLTGASSLKVRITLTTTTDSVTAFEIAFLTN